MFGGNSKLMDGGIRRNRWGENRFIKMYFFSSLGIKFSLPVDSVVRCWVVYRFGFGFYLWVWRKGNQEKGAGGSNAVFGVFDIFVMVEFILFLELLMLDCL